MIVGTLTPDQTTDCSATSTRPPTIRSRSAPNLYKLDRLRDLPISPWLEFEGLDKVGTLNPKTRSTAPDLLTHLCIVLTLCYNVYILEMYNAVITMSNKRYNTAWSKIGNSSGFRVENSFFKENPQFAGVTGEVQVINSNTLIVRLQPKEVEQEQDELMLSLFLDFLTEHALRNPDELESYTEAMAAEDDELIAGVILDS